MSERHLRAACILTEEGAHQDIRWCIRRWMRPRTHTRTSLHDTIGPHPVTATRVTSEPATLVTHLYGHVADQVHQRDRPAAGNGEDRIPPRPNPATMRHMRLGFTRSDG